MIFRLSSYNSKLSIVRLDRILLLLGRIVLNLGTESASSNQHFLLLLLQDLLRIAQLCQILKHIRVIRNANISFLANNTVELHAAVGCRAVTFNARLS